MRRWVIRLLWGASGVVVALALAGAGYQWQATRRDLAATPPPGRLVDVGGHRLHVWCMGTGSPAVVFDAGLGGSSPGWSRVQPDVARFTRACSYDRAGLGYSDPGPSPRTARRMARELAALVDRSGIGGPLVLVGASSGGLTMRVFASDFADRVAGLVLVDPTHEDQPHHVPAVARFVPILSSLGVLRLFDVSFDLGAESLAPAAQPFARATRFRAAGYHAAASEIIHIRESANEARTSRRVLAVPVVVVTGARGADEAWMALRRDQAALSRRGCHLVARQSGHVVAIDQPEVVVEAIRRLVDTARGRGDPWSCPSAQPTNR
jgi:pimeloyl-ACP methyl ester carboxylesterase